MEPTLPFASAAWLEGLARRLARNRGERRAQLDALGKVLGDPNDLARSYIEPEVQHHNPADYDEDRLPTDGADCLVKTPAFNALNRFLRGRGDLRDGRHQLFLLSDAGMGKTSLLTMLRLTHLARFWPPGYHSTLLKLGRDTVARLRDLPERGNTVLLLDALDARFGGHTVWGSDHEYSTSRYPQDAQSCVDVSNRFSNGACCFHR